MIHLLRVACATTPTWLETTAARASLLHVPERTAWAYVLGLVQRNLGSFTGEDRALLLGFIEDWARGVSRQSPYPEGAQSAVTIAYWLLPAFDDYQGDDQRKRVLRAIAKIPNADRARFAAVLRRNLEDEERDRAADDLREIVSKGMEGLPAARDLPDVVVQAATNYLLCSEEELRDGWRYGSDVKRETLFGIKQAEASISSRQAPTAVPSSRSSATTPNEGWPSSLRCSTTRRVVRPPEERGSAYRASRQDGAHLRGWIVKGAVVQRPIITGRP